uniref:NADH-ubiquinone oxidoreductase chain 6 n=1 Tax=Diplonychus rusticus TaxID=575839 RepID=C5HII2_9HEMI|nr:NADH dehydrogenase subunit 6 [Diplonychus rusticus]
MMIMILLTMVTMSIVFPMMKHPLSMGLVLLIQTLLTAIMSGLIINTFWFSYMLFIVLLGGMLVLFIYMASIASNEKFMFSIKITATITMLMMASTVIWMYSDKLMGSSGMSSSIKLIENDQMLSLQKFFSTQSISITIMMVTYLLITMIAVTYVVNIFEGPMRKKY